MATYWATDTGAGLKDGSSLANAAVVDASDANDIWSIVNGAGAPAADTDIRICGNASITATCGITQDATSTHKIRIQGRNAADTADAQVIIDAGGGAFSVFTFTTADYWQLDRITAYNTDKNAGSHGFSFGAGAAHVSVTNCIAHDVYCGFNCAGLSTRGRLASCWAHDCADDGFCCNETTVCTLCWSTDNTGDGFYWGTQIYCIADNCDVGFLSCSNVTHCVARGNNSHGFSFFAARAGNASYCIAEGNGTGGTGYGYSLGTTGSLHLLGCASYDNQDGRVDAGNYDDIGPVIYTSTAFVDADNGDFRLNGSSTGGCLTC